MYLQVSLDNFIKAIQIKNWTQLYLNLKNNLNLNSIDAFFYKNYL